MNSSNSVAGRAGEVTGADAAVFYHLMLLSVGEVGVAPGSSHQPPCP